MTEALASRIAGLKLGGIVAILLVPMLVLSYLMLSSLRQDIAFTQTELKGAQFNRLVMAVAMGAASGTLGEEEVQELRKAGAPLANELGLKVTFGTALAALMTYTADQRFAVDALMKLQVETASASGIILDSSAETYYLGSVITQDGPIALANYMRLQTLATRALRDGTVGFEEATQLLIAAGAWGESQNNIVQRLKLARGASASTEAFGPSIATAMELSDHAVAIARLVAKTSNAELAGRLAAAEEIGIESNHVLEDVSALWTFASDRFEDLLRYRLWNMQLRLYGLLGIAAAACMIGVGGAALMFRSTLRQLDDVKLARDQAEDARAEAEAAAEEVRRVNEDVVRLNADLADNLKRLKDMQDEALRKGKMAQLGQLTATVAHELRNPLGAVRTSAFLLERKVKGKGLGVEAQIERINNGVTRCDNIISQLLDFARSKAIQPETVVFDEWLARLIEEEAQRLPTSVTVECRWGSAPVSPPSTPRG